MHMSRVQYGYLVEGKGFRLTAAQQLTLGVCPSFPVPFYGKKTLYSSLGS